MYQSNLLTIGYYVLGLLVLGAQWTGVVALAKDGRTAAWWAMLAGTVLATVSTIGITYGYIQYYALGINPWGSLSVVGLASMMGSARSLGSLCFAIGFALHGLKGSRLANRVSELEQITAAQAQEINILQAPRG